MGIQRPGRGGPAVFEWKTQAKPWHFRSSTTAGVIDLRYAVTQAFLFILSSCCRASLDAYGGCTNCGEWRKTWNSSDAHTTMVFNLYHQTFSAAALDLPGQVERLRTFLPERLFFATPPLEAVLETQAIVAATDAILTELIPLVPQMLASNRQRLSTDSTNPLQFTASARLWENFKQTQKLTSWL